MCPLLLVESFKFVQYYENRQVKTFIIFQTTFPFRDTGLVLLLDLSKPEELWHTAEVLLEATRGRVEKLLADLKRSSPDRWQAISHAASERLTSGHSVSFSLTWPQDKRGEPYTESEYSLPVCCREPVLYRYSRLSHAYSHAVHAACS